MSTNADERRLVQPLAAVLGADEVMELLGLSAPTLRRLVKDGHLRAHRVPGGRNRLFRADEVLHDVSSWSSDEEEDDDEQRLPLPVPPAAHTFSDDERVDPTTVWCPAPRAEEGEKPQAEECAEAWLEAARRSGLEPVPVSPMEVDIDGRVYELRSGPRERVRVVDDDGEEAWQLIDAVWAEPTALDVG